MSSRYIEIIATQRPFPFNVDDNNRVMFSCNFTARAAGDVDDWMQEVQKILIDAGIATKGTQSTGDTYIGPQSVVRVGDGPFTTILDTGGIAPEEMHNSGVKIERLSVQIVVRAKSYVVAETRALAIWRELDGVRDSTVAA